MVERKKPMLDGADGAGREPLPRESVRVDRPPGHFSDPHAFPWCSSLAIGWSALLDRLFPSRCIPNPAAAPERRGEEDE